MRWDNILGAKYERGYVYIIHYHIIWCTKYRQDVFTNNILVNDMKSILERISDLNEINLEAVEIMPEYIHLLANFKPKNSITNVVKALKGGSGRMFFAKHPEIKQTKMWGNKLWSSSYFVSTVGNVNKSILEKYINRQYKKDLNSSLG